MRAVKAMFDGEQIVLAQNQRPPNPVEVIIIFPDEEGASESTDWLKAQEEVFAKVWDNPEDEVYDRA